MLPHVYRKRDTEVAAEQLTERKNHRPKPPPQVLEKMRAIASIKKHQLEMREKGEEEKTKTEVGEKKKRDVFGVRQKRDVDKERKKRASKAKGFRKWLRSRVKRRAVMKPKEVDSETQT